MDFDPLCQTPLKQSHFHPHKKVSLFPRLLSVFHTRNLHFTKSLRPVQKHPISKTRSRIPQAAFRSFPQKPPQRLLNAFVQEDGIQDADGEGADDANEIAVPSENRKQRPYRLPGEELRKEENVACLDAIGENARGLKPLRA